MGDILTSVGVQAALVGILTPVATGVLTARAGGSFWNGAWEGTPAGGALAYIAFRDKGILNPAFATDAFYIAYGTLWGTLIDNLTTSLGKNAHNPTPSENAAFIVTNLRNVSIARAFKVGNEGKFNSENVWLSAGFASASSLLVKSPQLLGNVGTNINRWWHDQPTDWSKSESIIVDSILSGIQAGLLNLPLPGGADSLPPFFKETFKQAAFNGYKQIIKYLFT